MFSKLMERLTPYKAGEQPQDKKYIKLNTNESPYDPGPDTLKALCDTRSLRLYPDPECTDLKKAIAKSHGLKAEQIFMGNGSDEVLAFCFGAFFDERKEIVFPDITYSFYPVYCGLYNIPYKTVPLLSDFGLDIMSINNAGGSGAVIANPNAPTGIAAKKQDILKIVKANSDRLVIIDEAYADFSDESVVSECGKIPNLIVVRTLSKSFSLAGLRVGYAVANTKVIEKLNAIKNSFNSYTVGTLNQAAATAAIGEKEYYMSNVAKIVATRTRMTAQLNKLGYNTLESGANFVFCRVPKGGENTYKYLKDQGILVRFFKGERTDGFIRITIGTDAEADALIKALELF